jgi:mannose-1-phosphate guanylyltransferase/phosphomannomutase
MTYAVEEDQPLGTAGCVKNISDLLTDTFLVISGDSVTDFDLQKAVEFHKQKGSKATLVLTRVPNPIEFGVVITDEENRIKRFWRSPLPAKFFLTPSTRAPTFWNPRCWITCPTTRNLTFRRISFPMLLEKGKPMFGYVADGYWCDVGHLEAYREAQYDALHAKLWSIMHTLRHPLGSG